MFILLLKATLAEIAAAAETAGAIVELRTSVDEWQKNPVAGVYEPVLGGWRFNLDTPRYANGFEFKFVIKPDRSQNNPNLTLRAPRGPDDLADDVIRDGKTYSYRMSELGFQDEKVERASIELGRAQRRIFNKQARKGTYEVIVIGSGMAGGTVADFASDLALDVLLLEAGGMLFPTHIGNLPRRSDEPGQFSKHIWSLWDRFQVKNYQDGSSNDYKGAQAFNLGGRSLFWGAFIPRMTSWELDFWPTRIKWYLEDAGYTLAEDFMGRSTGPQTLYNRQVHLLLRELFSDMHHADAPMAIRRNLEGASTIATGVFSTADILMESQLSEFYKAGKQGLDILLNHEVVRVESEAAGVRVVARDLVRDAEVSFHGENVVLSAGCIESARLAHRSNFPDPKQLIGKGVSDHPIFFTHFSIPRESPFFDPFGNVKILSQPKDGALREASGEKVPAPFNMLLELGADLNQGRYFDEDIWKEHLRNRRDKMLCEIVFLCSEFLKPENQITFSADARAFPIVSMKKHERPDLLAQTDKLKWRLLKALGAQPLVGEKIDFRLDEERWKQSFFTGGHSAEAPVGGVAHEVGSLRMQITTENGTVTSEGLVDENCLYLGLPGKNVYVCDLSIFPTTPAANPSLTLVALAIRLAYHLRDKRRPRTERTEEPFTGIADEVREKAEAFTKENDVEVTSAARDKISNFIPQLAKENAGWAEDLLRDLNEFLEIAAGLDKGLDLRNSLLRAAMEAAQIASMPATTTVDGDQIEQLIQALRQLLLPAKGIKPRT